MSIRKFELVFLLYTLISLVNCHGKLKIPAPRDEPGSGNWHYCGFFVNQYYLRGDFF